MLVTATSSVMATQVQLTLKNGKVISGELVSQNSTTVILKVVGIETRYDRNTIDKFEEILTPTQEYENRRAKLKDDDLEGRYKLASWLYEEEAYNQAEKELISLNKDFPQDTRVPLLLKIVRSKRRLKTDSGSNDRVVTTPTRPKTVVTPAPKITTNNPPTKPSNNEPAYATPLVPEGTELLTQEQIDVLKVYEVNLNYRPRVVFKRSDLEEFLTKYVGKENIPSTRSQRDRFLNRLEGYQQLDIMFKVKAREFYSKAQIPKDPEVFKEFKTLHRTYILNRCATSECHGGDEARGIFLFNRRPGATPDQIVYTNFYILNNYSATKDGQQYDMIDRASPERSLLLQFGMMSQDTVFPHPPVRGLKPAFLRGAEDRQYNTIRRWIQSLFSPTPDYGIDYKVSNTTPVIQPAITPGQ
ncbi:MAG TPA: hypothetical protein DCM28_23345 [Phycisphaerales bacterium]|nr:hypothetical protein [Phycisphaerales bacterium]HCD30917.1 hypothetical protein [Phycisphaerales bacterium]